MSRLMQAASAEGSPGERKRALQNAGAHLIPLPGAGEGEKGYLDLELVLEKLKSQGVGSLMVEGGARVITSFLAARLVDLLVLTISPRLVGGLHAPLELLQVHPKMPAPNWINLGDDQVVWGALEWARP